MKLEDTARAVAIEALGPCACVDSARVKNFGHYDMECDLKLVDRITPAMVDLARKFAADALKQISTVGPDVGMRKAMFMVNIQRSQCGLPTLAHAYNELDRFIAEAIKAAEDE